MVIAVSDVLQLVSLMLYASSVTGSSKSVDRAGSDLVGAVTVKPAEDEVDSEERDSLELLAGIDNENVRAAFTVCCSNTALQ